METFETVSTATALHYVWGSSCDGWHLVQHSSLSVIQERMPPGAAEVRHAHVRARQFFFILSGTAVLEAAGIEHELRVGQGLEVAPGVPHQIFNRSAEALELLVISAPPSHGDRML
jgi:mannose-6-phosphate isomerase-like protein (cupin superfamily)